jgi:PAS domain S-box-containing protein
VGIADRRVASDNLSVEPRADLSEPQGPDDALRESEERFRGAFYYSPIGMGIVDLEGRFVRVNPALCRIGGYEEEELLGLTFPDVVPADELEFHRNGARRLLNGEIEFYEREVRYRHKLGHLVWVRFTVSGIRDRNGRIGHLLGQAEDISARKDAEDRLRQSERLEAVGRLAGGVAHEFNNLLAVIGGFARHGLDAAASDSLRRDLTEIVGAADRASAISRQLLTFSRDQSGEPALLAVNDVVLGVEPLLRTLVPEGVDLVLALGEDLGLVHLDRAQLERVLLNIVVNARDATRAGGRIEIATTCVEVGDGSPLASDLAPGSYVALSIADTGGGIDPAAQHRLFDPFFTTKEQGEGAGLGLSTVYGIVEHLGGAVTVESEPGQGACFTVYVPRFVAADGDEVGRPGVEPALEGELGGGETILVVEDEAPLREFIELILSEAGYRVVTAADGEEALARVMAAGDIDFVLTDAIMPRLGGPELIQRLQQVRPEMRVLQISGYTTDGERGEDFIAKPFEPALLLRRVREILDRP